MSFCLFLLFAVFDALIVLNPLAVNCFNGFFGPVDQLEDRVLGVDSLLPKR